MKRTFNFLIAGFVLMLPIVSKAQKITDVNTPLHALKPDYPVSYDIPTISNVKQKLDIVYQYLNEVTPSQLIDKITGANVEVSKIDTNTVFKKGDFRIVSYEWGVTYAGMLAIGEATNDKKYIKLQQS